MKHKEIFLVPYAHLDTQWRWEYPTTINKYIKQTIDANIALFKKYKEHQFNFTGAIRYEFMKDYYPEKYKQVKKLIEDNRWHLSGTCLDETDALIPSMESMIRNILYGDQWQKKEFGKSSRDYMIPDCFGFPKNMPTVLNHCGIIGFSSQKLTWNSAVGIPFDIGLWKGSDSSEIVSALNPGAYVSFIIPPIKWNRKIQQSLYRLGQSNDIWKSFRYYGVGDIGGAPTDGSVKRAIQAIKQFDNESKKFTVKQGSPDQFFQNITQDEKDKMDSYQGDLLLINHSAGTLTSAAIMKRWNRKNEQLAYSAETAAVMANKIAGLPYPGDKIKQAWKRVIGSQMHDILPGTSTPLAYEYSQNDEVVASRLWTSVLHDSAESIAPYVKGNGTIMIFNPLAESRNDIVRFVSEETITAIQDADGHLYKVHKHEDHCSVKPLLQPLSYTKFSIITENTTTSKPLTRMENDTYIMENDLVRVSISKSGQVNSIFSKEYQRELLQAPLAYEFQKERPFQFPAWNMDWRDRKKPPMLRLEKGSSITIIDNSDILSTIQIITKHNNSTFIKDITITHDSSLIEFKEHIQWAETGCSLKLSFQPNIENPTTIYNWESDRVERGINNPNMFEVPSRLWMNIQGEGFGFSILEDSKYGYDRPSSNNIRMTLLYTPAIWYINGFWDQRYQDFGEHTIRYAIVPNNGTYENTDTLARQFNAPSHVYQVQSTNINTSDTQSFMTLDTSDVGISSMKQAEDSNDIVVRLYDRLGKDTQVTISSSQSIKQCTEINGIEQKVQKIPVLSENVTLTIPKNGLKSLLLTLKKHSTPSPVEYKMLTLPYDVCMISSNNRKNGLYPRELMPSRITKGALQYSICDDEDKNAVSMKQQSITLPKGYNTLSLLVSGDKQVSSTIIFNDSAGTTESVIIPQNTKFIGQWDTRLWKKPVKHYLTYKRDYLWNNKFVGIKPGFIHRDRLEYLTLHTHKNGSDAAYEFGYLFSIEVPIPSGATSVMLPDQSDSYLIAATVSNKNTIINDIKYISDRFDL